MNQMFCEAGPGPKAWLKYARVQRVMSCRKMPAQALDCSEVFYFFRFPPSNTRLRSQDDRDPSRKKRKNKHGGERANVIKLKRGVGHSFN